MYIYQTINFSVYTHEQLVDLAFELPSHLPNVKIKQSVSQCFYYVLLSDIHSISATKVLGIQRHVMVRKSLFLAVSREMREKLERIMKKSSYAFSYTFEHIKSLGRGGADEAVVDWRTE
jgi:hypothetical protein